VSALALHRGGAGEPLVLLHGLGSYKHVWAPVLPHLETQREVFAFDLPGFGDSPAGPESVDGLADAVERELRELGLERPQIAGNSLGGWTALELARRGRAHSVVALSPAGKWTRAENRLARTQLLLTYAVSKLLVRAGERPFTNPRVRRALVYGMYQHGEQQTAAEVAAATRALAESTGFMRVWRWTLHNEADGLEQIRCPVLIAWGAHDRLLPQRQGPRFAERIAGAELRILPGVGHIPMADDPELVARTILEFQDGAL
jgi:pimeloyl-ACP methyl ester carboxylesterase